MVNTINISLFFELLFSGLIVVGTFELVYIGSRALNTWKNEHREKEKIELLVKIIEGAESIKGLCAHAKGPIFSFEKDDIITELTKEKEAHPTLQIYPDRAKYLIPKSRINGNRETIMNFSTLKHKAKIYFGNEIKTIIMEIVAQVSFIEEAGEFLYHGNSPDTKLEQSYRDCLEGSQYHKEAKYIDPRIKKLEKKLKDLYRR